MAKKSVTKNYIYNTVYHLLLLVIPIFVTPYISRVLGENGVGRYSFTLSISSYFTLFASMGFGYYAQRLIASHQDDSTQQTRDFLEIIAVRAIPCLISIFIYLLLISLNIYDEKYRVLLLILSIDIVSVFFDIAFLFQGNEEFGKILIRNLVIKFISIICIFTLVKVETDLWKYAAIQSITLLACNLSLWMVLPKMLKKINIKELHPLKHLYPSLVLFLPTIAASIYTVLDKTLIGLITKDDAENGNYQYAESLVKLVMTLVTSLSVIMIPRNSKKYADGDMDGLKKNILFACKFVFLLGIPLMFGVMAISDNFIPWYLGPGYNKAANIMKIMSPIIFIIGLSNVFGLQLLVPCHSDNKFSTSIIIGAVTNFILNLILIPRFKGYGAAIATVIAEITVTTIMAFHIRKFIKFKEIFVKNWKYILFGLLMFIPCYFLGERLTSSILNSLIIAITGMAIYGICLLISRDEILYALLYKIKGFLKSLKNR